MGWRGTDEQTELAGLIERATAARSDATRLAHLAEQDAIAAAGVELDAVNRWDAATRCANDLTVEIDRLLEELAALIPPQRPKP